MDGGRGEGFDFARASGHVFWQSLLWVGDVPFHDVWVWDLRSGVWLGVYFVVLHFRSAFSGVWESSAGRGGRGGKGREGEGRGGKGKGGEGRGRRGKGREEGRRGKGREGEERGKGAGREEGSKKAGTREEARKKEEGG